MSMRDAKREIEAWRIDYNESRPQEALGKRTPQQQRDAGDYQSPWTRVGVTLTGAILSSYDWAKEPRQVRV